MVVYIGTHGTIGTMGIGDGCLNVPWIPQVPWVSKVVVYMDTMFTIGKWVPEVVVYMGTMGNHGYQRNR